LKEYKILVVGTGGRENAIAEALVKSHQVREVIMTRGNGGSELIKKCRRIKSTSIRAIEELREIAEDEEVDFTVVGPEASISRGITDEFRKKKLEIIAPSKKAAILETSKCWTKDYLKKIGVPIPEYEIFKNPEKAKEFVKENPKMRVVKADGIVEGKGTFVCGSLEETLWAIDKVFSEDFNQRYNNAGRKIEIEEKLEGEEISFFVLTDGEHVEFFGTARDYKKAFEEHERDRKTQRIINGFFRGMNPNSGGMGTISPHPLEKNVKEKVLKEIVFPTIENFPYRKEYIGIMHFVIMMVNENGQKRPKVLEITCATVIQKLRFDYHV